MNNDELIEYAIRTSKTIKEEVKLKLIDYFYKQKEVIEKAIEYLTSYSSIHTIQFGTDNDSLNDIELNKTLDEKTLNEMTNRYLKVHDKLLEILKEEEND